MAEGLQIDPTSELAANVPFDLIDGTNTFLLEAAYPPPERDQMWASSADTEGDLLVQTRYRNRVITVRVRVVGSSASNLQTRLGQLEQKIGKVTREGGTLKRTAPSGSTIVFDLLGATSDIPIDRRHLNINRAEVTIQFEAKPFGRGAPLVGSAHAESTLPVLVWTETGIAGDVPALGQLAVTDAQGADQWWLTWGVQSRYYDSAATAKLFYEAEDLTALGAAATNAGPSGASGSGGSKVIRSGALTTSYQGIVSTQATGGGAHLTHVGTFRVFARVQTASGNTGAVSVALEWAVGDFLRYTRNNAVTFPADTWDATWRLVDLGQVNIPKVATGSQRWEGRVLASSTVAGDTIDTDHLFLVPVDEGSGVASGVAQRPTPTTFTARDEFDHSAGSLAGKTLPIGGTWAGAGDAGDFTLNTTDHTIERVDTSDSAGVGRYAIAGTTALTGAVVGVDFKRSGTTGGITLLGQGVLLRYTDTNNYAVAAIKDDFSALTFRIKVAGTVTELATTDPALVLQPNAWYAITATVDSGGRFTVAVGFRGAGTTATLRGHHSELATGGTLASGKTGIYDEWDAANANTRSYDNFLAYAFVSDAAVFASQSIEVRHNAVIREDSAGAVYAPVSSYEGDYLLVPPAGREARTARFIVKATRNDPATMADTSIDDITATLTTVPRFLIIPE